jgi:hypothetical protein
MFSRNQYACWLIPFLLRSMLDQDALINEPSIYQASWPVIDAALYDAFLVTSSLAQNSHLQATS